MRRVGDIALTKIVGEGAVSAGVRRIEVLTGEAARLHLEHQASLARKASDALKTTTEELPARIEALIAERKSSSASFPKRRSSWRWAAAAAARRMTKFGKSAA
ncbi:MAG: hypothetical protein R3C58_11375 [Parvularculaceae bacterium]